MFSGRHMRMSARRKNDALAGQDLPMIVLVFDFLDTTEVRDFLAEHDFNYAGLSLENRDAFKGAPHAPTGEDVASCGCWPRLPLNGAGDFWGWCGRRRSYDMGLFCRDALDRGGRPRVNGG